MHYWYMLVLLLASTICCGQNTIETPPPAPKLSIIKFIRHNGGPREDAAVFIKADCGCSPDPDCNVPTKWWIKKYCGGDDYYLGYGYRNDQSLNTTTTYVAQCFKNGIGGPKSEIVVMVNADPNYDDCYGPERKKIDDVTLQDFRQDYHYYSRESVICNKSIDAGCTVENVFNSLLSNPNNTVPSGANIRRCSPLYNSWAEPFNGIGFSKYLNPEKKVQIPLNDCQRIYIPRPDFLVVAAMLSYLPCFGPSSMFWQFFKNYSGADPVYVKIDNTSKCVTNYTLPGHIFYPGKVTRCIKDNGCAISVVTVGEGLTSAGSNECGAWLANKNIEVGKCIFGEVDERFFINYTSR